MSEPSTAIGGISRSCKEWTLVCYFRTGTGVGKCGVNGWGLEFSAIGDGQVLQTQKIADPFAFCSCKTTKLGFNNNSP